MCVREEEVEGMKTLGQAGPRLNGNLRINPYMMGIGEWD